MFWSNVLPTLLPSCGHCLDRVWGRVRPSEHLLLYTPRSGRDTLLMVCWPIYWDNHDELRCSQIHLEHLAVTSAISLMAFLRWALGTPIFRNIQANDFPGNPRHPTSTAKHWAFQFLFLASVTIASYLDILSSWASSIRSSQGTVSSMSRMVLLALDVTRMSGRKLVLQISCGNTSFVFRSFCRVQSCASLSMLVSSFFLVLDVSPSLQNWINSFFFIGSLLQTSSKVISNHLLITCNTWLWCQVYRIPWELSCENSRHVSMRLLLPDIVDISDLQSASIVLGL